MTKNGNERHKIIMKQYAYGTINIQRIRNDFQGGGTQWMVLENNFIS